MNAAARTDCSDIHETAVKNVSRLDFGQAVFLYNFLLTRTQNSDMLILFPGTQYKSIRSKTMNRDQNYYFEHAPISKAITHFGIPTMIGMLVFILYNLVDTFFIGLLNDYNMLAGVALAAPLFTINMGIGNFFGAGCGNYISRLLGKKNHQAVRHASAFSLYGILAVGTVVTVLGFLFLDPVLNVLGASGETLAPTRQYASIVIAGSIPCMLSFAMGQIVRSEGAAKASMTGNIIGTVANIILDPVCIFLLGWGVAGAAIATVAANIFAVIYYMLYQVRKSEHLSLRPKDLKVDKEMLRSTASIGFPVLLLELITIATSLTLNNLAAGFGSVYVAVYGVIFKLGMLPKAFCPGHLPGGTALNGVYLRGKKSGSTEENHQAGRHIRQRHHPSFCCDSLHCRGKHPADFQQ